MDAAPNALNDAVIAITNESQRQLLGVWTKGFRDGLEVAAQITEAVGKMLVEKGGCDYLTNTIAQEIRLSALGVKEPTDATGS